MKIVKFEPKKFMNFKSVHKRKYFEISKKAKRDFYFLVGDIEAYLDEDNNFVFELGVFFDGVNFYCYYNLQDYYDGIIKFFEENCIKKRDRKIYFHNLNFDIIFFLKEIQFGEDVVIINSGNMMLSLKDKDFTFVNSLSLMPMSLKKVVKVWLSIDFKEWEEQKKDIFGLTKKELLEYCMRDNFLLYFAVFKLLDIVKSDYNVESFLTIPSLAIKIFKKQFNHSHFLDNRKSAFFNEDYYFGGHTEKFVEGVYKIKNDKINYYDVNSLFPFIMKDLEVCVSPFKMVKPTLKKIFELYYKGFNFFIDVLIEIKHDNFRVIPVKFKDSNYYPKGVFQCKISHITFDFLLKNNHLFIKEIYGIITHTTNEKEKVFKKYIEHFYDKRKKSLENDTIYKLLLNSLYGKFGQKTEQTRTVINPKDFSKFTQITEYSQDCGCNNFVCNVEEKGTYRIDYLRKDIAGMITEKARVYMTSSRLRLFKRGIKTFYQDTDSVMVNREIEYDYELKDMIDDKVLGLFGKENEKPIKNAYLIGLKLYYLDENLNAKKGLKNVNKIDYERIIMALDIIENSKRKYIHFSINGNRSKFCLFHYPNLLFYNSRFTQPKTFFNKGYFGIRIVPFFITKISEKLDKLPTNYFIKNKFSFFK